MISWTKRNGFVVIQAGGVDITEWGCGRGRVALVD